MAQLDLRARDDVNVSRPSGDTQDDTGMRGVALTRAFTSIDAE